MITDCNKTEHSAVLCGLYCPAYYKQIQWIINLMQNCPKSNFLNIIMLRLRLMQWIFF